MARKERKSNMELLRIVSMLFVLVLHANFFGIHTPSPKDLSAAPTLTFLRCFIEGLSVVAVNVFVLISGWFGIKFRFNKLGSLCFQVLFFSLGFFLVFAIISPSNALSLDKIKGILLMNGDYWFVKSYIVLFLLSPVLNAFVEHASHKQFLVVLLSYYTFHTVYGWLMDASVSFIMNGTTALSFVGLYMIGRYVRLYPSRITTMKKEIDLCVYVGCAFLLAVCCLFILYLGSHVSVEGRLFSYASPIIILSSIALLLFFSKLSFSSKAVNWIASSCFAVYLFHCNGFFFGRYYRDMIEYIYYDSGYAVLGIVAYIILIYAIAVLLDKVRIILWNMISKTLWKGDETL